MKHTGITFLMALVLGNAAFAHTLNIIATTTIVGDLVRQIGGTYVQVTTLMGPGVDPHLYKASAGDVRRMSQADAVFYGGLDLEGKMTEVFEQMRRRGVPTYAVAECVPEEQRIPVGEGLFDPHVWFDVRLWQIAAQCTRDALIELDPEHAQAYREQAAAYLEALQDLEAFVRARIAEIPPEKRVLITAHDAFGYFGRAYGIEVRGLLGVSTAAEAGTGDVQELARFIVERRIPAIFVESSIPERFVRAVQEAVRARGYAVEIGGELFSDALGDPGTPAGTYIGMVKHNVNTIVEALKR